MKLKIISTVGLKLIALSGVIILVVMLIIKINWNGNRIPSYKIEKSRSQIYFAEGIPIIWFVKLF